jgi:hypothetical protein
VYQRKYLILGALATTLTLGGLLVVTTTFGVSSNSSVTNAGQPPPQATYPVTLNTAAYVDHVVGQDLLLPNASVLGSGFKVVGVQIIKPPSNDTVPSGVPVADQITYQAWGVEIYISDAAFVNGSTTSSELDSQSVIVLEGSVPSTANSYTTAEDLIAPSPLCVERVSSTISSGTNTNVTLTSTSSSCSTGTDTVDKLVQMGNTYLAVNPDEPSAIFTVTSTDLNFEIYPGSFANYSAGASSSSIMSYQQLLGLAQSLIH